MGIRTKGHEQYKRMIELLVSLTLMVILTGIFAYVWYRYIWYSWNVDKIVLPFFRKGNWLVIAIYAFETYLFNHIYGGDKAGYLKRGDVIFSGILSCVIVNGITYLQISLIGRQFMDVRPVLGMSVVDIACIILWAVAADRLFQRLYPPRRMLVVFGSRHAGKLVYKMSRRSEKYEICEAVSVDEGLDEVYRRVEKYDSVLVCDVKAELRNEILKYCFKRSIRTYLTPKISDTIVRGADPIHLFDTPLLLCRNLGLSPEQRFFKRALDLLVSGLGILLSLPFMAVIALAVHFYDGGPVLYRQKRLTIGGRVFEVCKFRSMVVDAEKESGARLASENDDRITPVGKVLRKIRFDELPQLFNIFRGDMSIVGPRPERPEIAAEYEKTMPEFSFRLKVKAGLTGYAQVLGQYNTSPYDKLKLDLMYIENYSFFMDMKLILMTIKIVFVPESSQGIAEGTLTAMEDSGADAKEPPGGQPPPADRS